MERPEMPEGAEEELAMSAPDVEKNILNPDKLKSPKARTLALAMAMLTTSACGMTVTVSGPRIEQGGRSGYSQRGGALYERGAEPRMRPPADYCYNIDRILSSPQIREYKKEISTPQGIVILRGVEGMGGKNMTVEYIPPFGRSQRIDCRQY